MDDTIEMIHDESLTSVSLEQAMDTLHFITKNEMKTKRNERTEQNKVHLY